MLKRPTGPDDNAPREFTNAAIPEALKKLDEIISTRQSDPSTEVYTRIKKDIFHGFHSLPLSRTHGAAIPFLRALRDHIMRWDPVIKKQVEAVCLKELGMSFDLVLMRNPRWILERVPREIPEPSTLVPGMEHVFNMFANAKDAKTGEVLFTPAVWEKARALLELARQGYFSDLPGVPMYEKAGVDKYRLQKWRCLRGTNKVEGGPHGDIYRKFGPLNGQLYCVCCMCRTHADITVTESQIAGPRLAVNLMQDHKDWYNLQVSICSQMTESALTYRTLIFSSQY